MFTKLEQVFWIRISSICSFLQPLGLFLKVHLFSRQLLDHCLAPDTSGDGTGCDNMTCVIITLRPHPSAASSEDPKKRKHQEEAGMTEEPEENGNNSKKAKSD